MSPFTKKPLTRDIPTTGPAHAVPIVTTGTISKVKPTSAATKKHVNSKLGEAIQSQVSSVTSPVTSNSATSPVIISDDMVSSFDSDSYYLQQTSVPSSQPDTTIPKKVDGGIVFKDSNTPFIIIETKRPMVSEEKIKGDLLKLASSLKDAIIYNNYNYQLFGIQVEG
ncbi:hypothetical protein BD770DRAFT_384994 [Pilaira anomala]|nr:hypothetical protein BD770DRAFT_384994 [Pilaira anomala]